MLLVMKLMENRKSTVVGSSVNSDEGHHQARAQLGAEHLALAVVEQFDQVAEHQENHQQQQQQVEVDQNEHQDRVGNRKIDPEVKVAVDPRASRATTGMIAISISSRLRRLRSPVLPGALGILLRFMALVNSSSRGERVGKIIDKVDGVPIGSKIPKGHEKKGIVQIKGQCELAQLGLGPDLVLRPLDELLQRNDF